MLTPFELLVKKNDSGLRRNLGFLLFSSVVVGLTLGSLPMAVSSTRTQLSLELWYTPERKTYFPDVKNVAEIIQKNLHDVGVKIKLITWEWSEYIEKTKNGNHDMALQGWSADIGDPDNFIYVLLAGASAKVGTATNIAFYNNPEVNDLLDVAHTSNVQTLREKLYKDACWIIYKDAPWVPIAHSQYFAGVLSTVSGFNIHPTGEGANVYTNVSISSGTQLIVGRSRDSVTLDPAEWTDVQSRKVGRQIYEGLFNLPADSIDPSPALSTNYIVSSDGKKWTFTLRQGVKFHDGTNFNASAVVFSFERAKYWDDNTSIYYTNGWVPPEAAFYDRIYSNLILNVTAVDDYKVKFTLEKPYAPFLVSLAKEVFAIVSPSYVKNHPGTQAIDRLGLKPVGTGPFKLKSWVKDSIITLETFTDYWGAVPKEDELIFKVIPEIDTRLGMLTSTSPTIHIVDNIPASDAKTVEETSGVSLVTQTGMNVVYLAMNRLRAPFDNTTLVDDPDFGGKTTHGNLVSRAFNYIIDRDTILEHTYKNRAIKAKNPLPPSIWGYNNTHPQHIYNTTYAAELLEYLGYDIDPVPIIAGFSPIITIITTLCGFVLRFELTRQKKK